jgi:hypothetical protein
VLLHVSLSQFAVIKPQFHFSHHWLGVLLPAPSLLVPHQWYQMQERQLKKQMEEKIEGSGRGKVSFLRWGFTPLFIFCIL